MVYILYCISYHEKNRFFFLLCVSVWSCIMYVDFCGLSGLQAVRSLRKGPSSMYSGREVGWKEGLRPGFGSRSD